MNYNIYIDESGNTGNIEMDDDLKWNFENQTHFALGSIYMKEDIAKNIEENIKNILHKYDEKLGTENELKSKAKYTFKNDLLKDITNELIKNKVGFYFDISSKKYKVITTMVSYCVYPYYTNKHIRTSCVDMANFLYRTLPLNQIQAFIVLCQSSCDNEQCVTDLISYLEKLDTFLVSNKKGSIKSVIDIVKNHNNLGLSVRNLFPIKDFNNKGVEESFLPNVDAFNNLIVSIYKLRLREYDIINIYHDEQKQFSNVLTKWVKSLEDNGVKTNVLEFPVSKENILIQIVDYYTGSIVRLYRKIIEHNHIKENEKELIKILKPLFCNCNVVAPEYEQKKFFETCGLKLTKTQIPF
jgi:hypothetical protein